MDLKGKTVFYVGAFGGIGLETSKKLLTKNLKNYVILEKDANDDLLQTLQALAPATKVFFFKFDVTMSMDTMKTIFKEICAAIKDTIDILIYGAGICNDQLPELSIQINLTGMIQVVSCVMPLMDKRKGGQGGMIVNIASSAGLDAYHYLPVYGATKAAMVHFSRALAAPVLYSKTNVAFVLICPAITTTPLLENIKSFLNYCENLNDQFLSAPGQSAEICGKNIVDAIEVGQNGAIWMLRYGKMELVKPHIYWNMPEDMKEIFSKISE